MTPSIEAILEDHNFNPADVERVRHRRVANKIEVVEPDASWPDAFEGLKSRISAALGATALSITHVGSTSVPGLPAKPLIDIDLTVPDVTDEDAYVPRLAAAGFDLLLREPSWHQHRFMCAYDPVANIHVWGPDCPEPVRHIIFRDWLIRTPADRDMYAQIKRESAVASNAAGEDVMGYNDRKGAVLQQILDRAFRDKGYIQ